MRFTSKMPAIVALAFFVDVIVYGSLYPFEYRPRGGGALTALLLSVTRSPSWGDIGVNILFYAPLGFLGALVMSGQSTPWRRIGIMLLVSAALSVGNELLQYYVGRWTNAFDVAANSLGASLGAATASLAASLVLRQPRA